MSDASYTLRFGEQYDRVLRLVCGDTRNVTIAVRAARTEEPADLTGAQVVVCLPQNDGGAIRRRSTGWTVQPVLAASTTPQALYIPEHGLVPNELVSFMPVDDATLPDGLATATTYAVNVIDDNTFSLAGTDGTAVAITTAGTGKMVIWSQSFCAVPAPTSGIIQLPLNSNVTQALNIGQGQAVQVNFTIGDSTRVIVSPYALDVTDQAYP